MWWIEVSFVPPSSLLIEAVLRDAVDRVTAGNSWGLTRWSCVWERWSHETRRDIDVSHVIISDCWLSRQNLAALHPKNSTTTKTQIHIRRASTLWLCSHWNQWVFHKIKKKRNMIMLLKKVFQLHSKSISLCFIKIYAPIVVSSRPCVRNPVWLRFASLLFSNRNAKRNWYIHRVALLLLIHGAAVGAELRLLSHEHHRKRNR